MRTLKKDEYASYFEGYIQISPKGDILKNLRVVHEQTQAYMTKVGEINGNFQYEPDKWTLKQVLHHIIDTERIMAYRALRFAREDSTPLPGFDHNTYAIQADLSNRTIADLMKEFAIVRRATIEMYQHFSPQMLDQKGVASDNDLSVYALAHIIMGHELHHINIIKERYLGHQDH